MHFNYIYFVNKFGQIRANLLFNSVNNSIIGYCIRPTEREKGYNKINLYLGLLCCQEHGIKEVLMDCDKENIASAKTMLALGGKLIKEYYDEENAHYIVQDYTIDVDKAIKENQATYSPLISTCR